MGILIGKIKKEKPDNTERKKLEKELTLTKNALLSAQSNFDNATDPDLIDCYIYKVQSEELRYKFLLSRARELNM